MRTFLYLASALCVIGLAFWAYRENYETQSAISRSEQLQGRIAEARTQLNMLRAEWAYLNRPDRLRELAEINFPDLELQPLDPQQFGKITQVRFPPLPAPEVIFNNPVDVSSLGPAADQLAAGDDRP
ncbi:cell division protein FtsL [Oceanicola sp. S124]|uniref:cell division protein FtsL n=1 Tax=Oceanicola sp. S124 TaxID=1042378 RepID=UPI00025588EB|nr:cell division protein FtsL [Oceanicola sp. S124]